MCKVCVDFKKKCIEADHTKKIQSNERFLWVENLRELRKYQPIEDEVLTIETIEPMIEEPPVVPEIKEIAPNYKISPDDNHSLDFIEKLTHDQLKEMTDEVTKLLANEIFESEQFQFIKARVAKKSTTTLPNTPNPAHRASPRFVACRKCNVKFPDYKKLMIHKRNAHRRRKLYK